jgi:GT2 family glycosyltransferase
MNVDIVIPVFNSLDYVQQLMVSLDNVYRTGLIISTYIVDDASEIETNNFLENYVRGKSGVYLIRNESNIGYTKSLNIGIRAGHSEFVMQVNSDCILSKKIINKLLAWFRRDADLFAISPLSNAASWQSIPQVLDEVGAMAVNALFDGFSVDDMDDFCHLYNGGLAEGQLLNGFCVMYRRGQLEDIGLPDENAFSRGYGEEDDLHIRAANQGFKLGVATDAYVFHAKTKSFSDAEREKLVQQGRKILDSRHGKSRIQRLASSMRRHPRLESIRASATHFSSVCSEAVKECVKLDWDGACKFRSNAVVSIVMPVYTDGKMTYDAISSIYENTHRPFELIVVSNGADKECLDYLYKARSEFRCRLLLVPKNLYFSTGCNLGFMASLGKKVVFVNNDMLFPDQNWLDSIALSLDDSEIGAAGIKLLYEDLTIQSAGLIWSSLSFIPLGYKSGGMSNDMAGRHYFYAITGACLGMRAEDFSNLRGFDPLYVNGSEDIDLCLKVKYCLNKRCIIDGDAYAIHLESKTPGRGLHIQSNRILFFKRWAGYISALTTQIEEQIEPADKRPIPIRRYKMRS